MLPGLEIRRDRKLLEGLLDAMGEPAAGVERSDGVTWGLFFGQSDTLRKLPMIPSVEDLDVDRRASPP